MELVRARALVVGILAVLVGSAHAQECMPLWGQCGGKKWTGPTCCEAGSECVKKTEWYSSCRRIGFTFPEPPTYPGLPVPNEEINSCSTRWSQCGGIGWTGPTCCAGMNTCVPQTEWYSQCKPAGLASSIAMGEAQCGGAHWVGPTQCEDLFTCVVVNEWYAQCQYTVKPKRVTLVDIIPPMYTGGAAECSPKWGQCGGKKWTGPTCCEAGLECVKKTEWYSSCRDPGFTFPNPPTYPGVPVPNEEIDGCSTRWSQCGGKNWEGPTCCAGDNECVAQNEWYSQCKPLPLAAGVAEGGAQCGGGDHWEGPTECEALFTCVVVNKWYSQCQYTVLPTRRAAQEIMPPVYTGEPVCSPKWGQCGGKKWTGPTCCADGNECVKKTEWYSSCRKPGFTFPKPPTYPGIPIPNTAYAGCAMRWSKCGGNGWTGPTCCAGEDECVPQNEWYSQCKPKPLAAGVAAGTAQCGGENWQGPTTCEKLYKCVEVNRWYSQCQLDVTPSIVP